MAETNPEKQPQKQAATESTLPPEEVRHSDGRIEHPRVRREARDVRFRWVAAFVAASLLLGGAQVYVVWKIFQEGEAYFGRARTETAGPRPPSETRLPEQPRLEQLDRTAGIEHSNVRHLETIDLNRLNRFGTTADAGYIHIPIDDAMDLIVDRLPIREGSHAEDPRSLGLLGGGESNSGRMFRRANP